MEQHRKGFIHHQRPGLRKNFREIVFGMQDGMVSTLGAVTGIAVGTNDQFVVLLAGVIVIVVESISMSIGSFTSSASERDVQRRMLYEENIEIQTSPEEEKKELRTMFIDDGWPDTMADAMTETASRNKDLMLREMAYRELSIFPDGTIAPLRNGLFMLGAYIAGGAIPLIPYFLLLPLDALPYSIGTTLAGLFALGAFTALFTRAYWVKAGFSMLGLGSIALVAGYAIGKAGHEFSALMQGN